MMNIDFDKKGLIVLSTYRSGGTQLTRILDILCVQHFQPNCDDKWVSKGEVEVDIIGDVLTETMNALYSDEKRFQVWLLNNPLSILALYSNNKFSQLVKDYNIIHLSRLNKANGILSLGLWERMIEYGAFSDGALNKGRFDKQAMQSFHTHLLSKPLSYVDVSLGHSALDEYKASLTTVGSKLMIWTYQDNINKCLASMHRLPVLFYEEYEQDHENFLKNHFPWANDVAREEIKNTYRYKIPYVYKDYRKYYQDDIIKLMNEWGIKNL